MGGPYTVSALAAKTVVVYRTGDSNSLNFANYYAAAHGLSGGQIIGVPCSTNEIVSSYATFQSEVENSLLAALPTGTVVIVLGFNVPGGFLDGTGDTISATSRLSRVGTSYTVGSKNAPNPLYGRQSSQRMVDADFGKVRIVSRIDAPTLTAAKAMVDAATFANRQGVANGTFYFDPWQVIASSNSTLYASDLTDFLNNTLPELNLTTFVTDEEGNQDVVLPYALEDSYLWSCGNPTADASFFHPTASPRVFLYNADSNSASTLRSATSTRWPTLASLNGYAATAGSLSFNIGNEDHYPRPSPFFEAMIAGAGIGEAYCFAIPYLDCPETLIGDPLVSVGFPLSVTVDTGLSIPIAVDLMIDRLSQAAASIYQYKLYLNAAATIANTWDIPGVTSALSVLTSQLSQSYVTDLCPVARAIVTYGSTSAQVAPTNATVAALLGSSTSPPNIMVGQLFVDELANYGLAVPSTQILEDGAWQFDFVLQNLVPATLSLYQFELDVATDSAFRNVLIHKDSVADQTGWVYQGEPDAFVNLTLNGVSSSYAGRYIRYRSDIATFPGEVLVRGTLYYVRYRQKIGFTAYSYTSLQMGVYS